MNIGIICYASVGGSGIVATELAKALADRGHQVHLVSTDPPFRLGDYQAGLVFHQVNTPSYPLFREPQYVLSLANKVVQVAREFPLQIIHAHYAIPHATAPFPNLMTLVTLPEVSFNTGGGGGTDGGHRRRRASCSGCRYDRTRACTRPTGACVR